MNLTYEKAQIKDLDEIIRLLAEDELGKTRESGANEYRESYIEAFNLITQDPNQFLMIVKNKNIIVATCHLTFMPSLTFNGGMRMQIEAVRVANKYRGQKIGKWMIRSAIDMAKERHVKIIQLTTNVERVRAKNFYEGIGFKATHLGMKLYV